MYFIRIFFSNMSASYFLFIKYLLAPLLIGLLPKHQIERFSMESLLQQRLFSWHEKWKINIDFQGENPRVAGLSVIIILSFASSPPAVHDTSRWRTN